MSVQDNIVFILEIIGTVAFAVSGALVGIRRSMDIFGVCVLGVVTAVGGGAIRTWRWGSSHPMCSGTRSMRRWLSLCPALSSGSCISQLPVHRQTWKAVRRGHAPDGRGGAGDLYRGGGQRGHPAGIWGQCVPPYFYRHSDRRGRRTPQRYHGRGPALHICPPHLCLRFHSRGCGLYAPLQDDRDHGGHVRRGGLVLVIRCLPPTTGGTFRGSGWRKSCAHIWGGDKTESRKSLQMTSGRSIMTSDQIQLNKRVTGSWPLAG